MQFQIVGATHMAIQIFPYLKIVTTIVRSVKLIMYIHQRMPMKPPNMHYGSMTMVHHKKIAIHKYHPHVILSILRCKIIPIATHNSTNITLMHQMMVNKMYSVMVHTVNKMQMPYTMQIVHATVKVA